MRARRGRTEEPIPSFTSEAEAAAFWDSHSPLDYPGHFQEAEVTFDRPLIKRGLTVKLEEETIAALREIARAQGIGPSTLARMWILDRLNAMSTGRKPG